MAAPKKSVAWLLAAVMSLGVASSFWLDWQASQEHMESVARERGAALFKLVELTRRWNAEHGGVYVPVTPGTPPNPYLDHPKRDVQTRDGTRMTMVNPAYMTRQLAELAQSTEGIRIHLTSNRPIRPANKPEPWEAEALRQFEAGQKESIVFVPAPAPLYRYMAPLRMEATCMQCHATQGYQVGQIRGGISVSMPAAELVALRDKDRWQSAVAHGLVFSILSSLLYVMVRRIRQHWDALDRINRHQEQLIAERTRDLQQANVELAAEVSQRVRCADGSSFVAGLSVSRAASVEPPLYVVTLLDISAYKDTEDRLRHQAQHDALTGLPNRTLFADRLEVALTQAQRHERRFALLFLDVDHFKEVNDQRGHAVGDALLAAAATRLLSCVRQADTVARLGGDEFAVLLSEFSTEAEIHEIAQRLVTLMAQPFELGAVTVQVSASVGIALYPEHAQDAHGLKVRADEALYAVKAGGRNGYRLFAAGDNRPPHGTHHPS